MEVRMKLAPKLNVVGIIVATAVPAAFASIGAGNAEQIHLPSCNVSGAIRINGSWELYQKMAAASKAPVVCFEGDYRNTKMFIRASGTYRFQGSTFKNLKVHADDVIIDGIHVNAQGDRNPGTGSAIKGDRTVINNSLFENVAGTTMVVAGSDVTIQNSTFKDTKPEPRKDRHCIFVQAGAHRLKILNNTIFDCAGDGIQVAPNASGPRDALIADNHIFITDKMIQPDGSACAEDALDFKGGRGVVVRNNTMHGFRPTDKNCGGTGSKGAAVVIHMKANNYTLENNEAYDVRKCYVVKIQNKIIVNSNNTCKTDR
jgi:hypothetical protein